MAKVELNNWQKKSKEHYKQYKSFLQRADKNKVLKQLPDLHEEAFEKQIVLAVQPVAKIILPGLKPRILNVSVNI